MHETGQTINRNSKLEDLPEYLTVQEFLSYLRMGRTALYELVRNNKIEHVRFGRRIFIPKTVLNNKAQEEK